MQDDADGNGRDPDADPAPDVERAPNGPTAQPPADTANDADAGTGVDTANDAGAEMGADAASDADAKMDADAASDADPGTDADAAGDADAEAVEGVDTEHVMNLTFVLTLFIGVPTVVVLSLFVPLDGWNEIIMFVVRVGAAIWFLTAVTLYLRERVRE